MKTNEIGPSRRAGFACVPDVRSRHGRRSRLPALLTPATAAMLSGARSLSAIAQGGRLPPLEVRRARGVAERERGMPAITTLHSVFKRLDAAACEAALSAWAAHTRQPGDRQPVVDGKAVRGSHGEEVPGVRLVAVCAPEASLGDRRQRGVRTKAEPAETQAAREQAQPEAELSGAPRRVEGVRAALAGRVVSGEARSCQKARCRPIREAGGDSLVAVKGNQPTLLEDVSRLFTDPPPGERFLTARTVNQPGGRLEERRLRASATLAAYLHGAGWPDGGLGLAVAATGRWPRRPDQPIRPEGRSFLSSLTAPPHRRSPGGW